MSKQKNKNLLIGLFLVLISSLLINRLVGDYIVQIFAGFFAAALPIILGAVVAYLLKKVLYFLENKAFKKMFLKAKNRKNIIRVLSLSIIFTIFLGLVVGIVLLTIPPLVSLASELLNNIENYTQKMAGELTQLFGNLEILQKVNIAEQVKLRVDNLTLGFKQNLPSFLEQVINIASNTTVIIFSIILSFILAFLMLKDKEKINEGFKRFIYANFKTYRADNIIKTLQKSDGILHAYFIGKLIEAAIVFVLVAVGFFILGVPEALLLAGILAVLNFVPYIGAIIGLIPTLFLTAILTSLNKAFVAVIVALSIIILVTSFISPVIFGKKLNISALLVILSIIIGGGMFGMVGMLLAPPIVAIISVLIEQSLKQKEEDKLKFASYGLAKEDLLNEEVLLQASLLVAKRKKDTLKKD